MTFHPLSSSHSGGFDIEAIRQFWVGALQRLKVHAELAELEAMYASGTEQDFVAPQRWQRDADWVWTSGTEDQLLT